MIVWISYILFWGFLFLTPALSIGLGVYAGFSIKKRWFYPVLGYSVYLLVYGGIFMHCSIGVLYGIFPILPELFKIGWLRFLIIAMLGISHVVMLVTAVMRRKEKRQISFLVSMVPIAVTVFLLGTGLVELREDLREKYCTTYYKYPDELIRNMDWSSIQKRYGSFDQMSNPLFYSYWGAYYTYTDEQENDWYYTVYFEEGRVTDIRMEIH